MSDPPGSKPPAMLFARLNPGVALEKGVEDRLSARFDGARLSLGIFGAAAPSSDYATPSRSP
jgi:hypothetical protein